MSLRPVVSVQGHSNAKETVATPDVFRTPIRSDVVSTVHSLVSRNHRQAYAVSEAAGHQTSAESWGTGRAVARIPRVPGGGTHRAGQGAFGNMCRGGRMFAPTKTWRRWHRRVSKNHKRYAIASAVAASAIPALVMARGHRISQVREVPLVVADQAFAEVRKTRQAATLLKTFHAQEDVEKSSNSKHVRTGKGKSRNRRYRLRRGPLVVYTDASAPFVKPFRNIPGVETINVTRLNLLSLAPGGHLGRFVIWTHSAFKELNSIFGTSDKATEHKKHFRLPRSLLSNADLNRIINSDEVQSAIRLRRSNKKVYRHRLNPLTNLRALKHINPFAVAARRKNVLAAKKNRAARLKARKEGKKLLPVGGTKPKKGANKKFVKLLRSF